MYPVHVPYSSKNQPTRVGVGEYFTIDQLWGKEIREIQRCLTV